MNETLKFSWGHIIAFLALIAVGYVSFVGYAYLTDGNFYFAIAGMVATIIVFFAMFMGMQWLKADGNKIDRKILMERIIVFASPLVFTACMVGFAHFWTVKAQDAQIVETFLASINNSRQMFSDFENYSNQRIANYDATLSKVIEQQNQKPSDYKKLGFKSGYEEAQKKNMVEVLRLQLLSDNFTKLKEDANNWIDKANNGASTWNVFLIGNTREIKSALTNWEKDLADQSQIKLEGEEIYGPVAPFESHGAIKAGEGLDYMSRDFNQWKFPVWQAFFFGAIIYVLLLFPYFLQSRHGRQVAAGFTLFSSRKKGRSLDDSPFLNKKTVRNPAASSPQMAMAGGPVSPQQPESTDQDTFKTETQDETPIPNPVSNRMKQLKKRTL